MKKLLTSMVVPVACLMVGAAIGSWSLWMPELNAVTVQREAQVTEPSPTSEPVRVSDILILESDATSDSEEPVPTVVVDAITVTNQDELPTDGRSIRNQAYDLWLAGQAYYKPGPKRDLDRSERLMLASIEKLETFAPSHNALGRIEIERKNFDLAKQHFIKSTQVDTTYAHGYFNLASLDLMRGNKKEAVVYLKKTLSADPDYKPAQELLLKLDK